MPGTVVETFLRDSGAKYKYTNLLTYLFGYVRKLISIQYANGLV